MGRSHPDTLDVTPEYGRDYTDIELPEALARRMRVMVNIDQAPGTLGELGRLFEGSDALQAGDRFTWQDLLVSDGETRHEVRTGEQLHHTYCILDALVLPFLLDQRVEIRSRPPGAEQPVAIVATPDRLEASPATAVVSFGASLNVPASPEALDVEDEAGLLDLTHAEGCPKINAFPDEAAYQAWARETEAATVVMSLAQAYAMAHDTAGSLGPQEL